MELLSQTLGILISYLLGALPFGIIVTRIAKSVDVREHGSGSSGFTNVYRVAGIGPGIVVALLDIAKGLVVVMLVADGFHTGEFGLSIIHYQIICGCFAVIGHIFTVFARFRGGKGVLVALGVCVGLIPTEVAIAAVVFVIVFALFRYISAGSLAASTSLPVILIVEKFVLNRDIDAALLALTLALAGVIFFAHRENIRRLIRGEENKFSRVKV
jgi:glycerol-3-phosphate acyltransferase PlsY